MNIRFSYYTRKKLADELQLAKKLNNLTLFKKVKCFLLIHEGRDLREIIELLNIAEKTIYNWLSQFMIEGLSSLYNYHYQGRGRPAKITDLEKKILYKLVVDGPKKSGYDCGGWNSAMIADLIRKKFNVKYNSRYVSSLLKRMGLSYQKAKFISDHFDKKKRKEWREKQWPQIVKKAKKQNALIFFGDEVSFAQWGSLGRTWGAIGEQPEVKTTGKRKGLKMFGAIDFMSGAFVYMECKEKFNGMTYIKFLKKLLKQQSDRPIILIEDGARYHDSAVVKVFKESMEKENKLYTHKLPAYSPDYNPIEKLWKNTKRDATHLKYFPTFEDLRGAVVKAFRKYMRDASKIICVMKKWREEAGIA